MLNAWDGILPLNGWQINDSSKEARLKDGRFTGVPHNRGASQSLDFQPPQDLKSFNRLELQIEGNILHPKDLKLSLRGPAGTQNMSFKATAENGTGSFVFRFGSFPAPLQQLRIYYNQSGRLNDVPVSFVLKSIRFAAAASEKMLTRLPWHEHRRVLDRTWIFPRIQAKYDLMENYLDAYCLDSGTFNDRPLFFDRSLAGSPLPQYDKLNTPAGFQRQLACALEFTDGFALFATPLRPTRFLKPAEYADEKKLKNVLLMEIVPVDLLQREAMEKTISAALASPAVFKNKGKLILGCYHGDDVTPDKWRQLLKPYRDKFPGKLLFLCELRGLAYQICSDFKNGGGQIPERKTEKYKDCVRRYLDVVDGINFSGSNHITAKRPGFPENVFNAEAYEKFIVPLFASVLDEPRYAGEKLLGLSAHKVYCQVRNTSSNVDEEGTLSLRSSLKTALAACPDLIILPEWNEVNENTHIEPVVSDAKATPRVINALRGRETADADCRCPNMILSFRQENEPGAPIPIELLGLPDPNGTPYSVTLKLFSPSGKLLKTYPPARFSGRETESVFHLEPAVQFADWRYLIVELELKERNGETTVRKGLPHIRLVTPPNIFHRYVKIPLRDLPPPEKITAAFEFSSGRVKVSGHVECPETISSVELMADDIPLAAFDPRHEFTPPPGYVLLDWCRQTPVTNGYAEDTVAITALTGRIQARTPHQYGLSGMKTPVRKGQRLTGPIGGGSNVREFLFFATPDAELEITQRGEKAIVKAADVIKNRRWRQCSPAGDVSWRLKVFDRLPEVPFPPGVRKLDYVLEAPLASHPNPVYYLRVVTHSGRVFRSEPSMPSIPSIQEGKVTMPVWDMMSGQVEKLVIPAGLAHDVVYEFDPRLNHLLPAQGDCRAYDGLLGGFDYWTHSAPGWNMMYAPGWIKEDGRWLLDFKPGAALLLPPPVFSKGAFTVEMEFRLRDTRDQVLLDVIYNQLPVKVKDGILHGSIVTKNGEFHWSAAEKLQPGHWYSLKLVYDLNRLTVILDGRQAARIPASAPVRNGWLLSIGGVPLTKKQNRQDFLGKYAKDNLTPDPGFRFDGSLRALRVRNF